jgi:hypothetical protein
MKPRWLTILLVVSLAGNAVELGLYAWSKWRRFAESQEFFKRVQVGAQMWTLRVVVKDFEPQMRILDQRKERWNMELQWQDYQAQPDTQIDRIALDSIASITRQEYKLTYDSRRALPSVPDAKLRARMEKRWRGQMGIGN